MPASPDEWTVDHPYVISLLAGMAAWRAEADLAGPDGRTTLLMDYFEARAREDGVLPGYRGKLSEMAIEEPTGLSRYLLRQGTRARAALDRWSPFFILGDDRPDYASMPEEERPVNVRVRDYIVEKVATLGSFPSAPAGWAISLFGVAEESGIPLRQADPQLAGHEPAAPRGEGQDGAARAVHVSAAPLVSPERLAELLEVARSFDFEGGKVPENPRRRGAPDWDRIAQLTGKAGPNGKEFAPYFVEVMDIVNRPRDELPGVSAMSDTFASLMVWGLDQIESDQKARGLVSWANGVANHKSALERFVDRLGLTTEDEVEEHFGDEFDALVLKASDGLSSGSAGNFGRSMTLWREHRVMRFGMPELSPHFGVALKELTEHRGWTMAALARQVGCPAATISGWMDETRGVSKAHIPWIRKIEKALRAPSGTMLGKVVHGRTRKDWVGGATEHWLDLDAKVRALLPYEAAFWREEALGTAVEKVEPLLGTATAFGELCKLSQLETNRLEPLRASDALNAQLDHYEWYKTTKMPYPLLRASRWSTEHASRNGMQHIRSCMRFACSSAGGGVWSGLGLPAELQTIAWCAVAPIALAFPGQRARRYEDMEWKGDRRGLFYTDNETGYIDQLLSLTNPDVGYLVQMPELAETLVPLGQTLPRQFDDLLESHSSQGDRPLLTEQDVADARRDWKGWLDGVHKRYLQAREHVGDVAQISRNPYESIAGLILAPEPIAEYMTLLYRSERHWACPRTAKQAWCLDVRDAAMNRLAPMTAVRPSNLAELGYDPKQTGEIRKVDGVWSIEIHYKKFKNWPNVRLFGTKTAPKNFKMILEDDCDLYSVLDTWFFEALPSLGEVPGAAFVSRGGVRMNAVTYATALKEFARHHVAWNPVLETGFPGVTALNPYQIRHLRASDTLKTSKRANRVEEASFALQTSENMIINHYGFLVPEEAILDAYATFTDGARKAWERMRIG